MIKFKPKFIQVSERPIIVVGEKPNKTRDNSTFSLMGNKTGDFVMEAVGNKSNIILTNVVNTLYSGSFRHDVLAGEGLLELIELVVAHQPSKIICLGGIAREYVDSIKVIPQDCVVTYMPHPSVINRFLSKQRQDYINHLSHELNQ